MEKQLTLLNIFLLPLASLVAYLGLDAQKLTIYLFRRFGKSSVSPYSGYADLSGNC